MAASIVFACDDNYAGYTSVAIRSIIENSKENRDLDFYIFDSGISEQSKKSINKLKSKRVNIFFVEIDKDIFKNFPLTIEYISIATYFRLKLPSILSHLSKVIYLDVDILVNGEIFELFDVDLKGKSIGAVADPLLNHETSHLSNIGFKNPCSSYFNAGVLLIDLEKLRKINFENKVDEYLKKYKDKIKFQDQDILNVVLENDVNFISPKFNYMPAHRLLLKSKNKNRLTLYPHSLEIIKNAKNDAIVFHYCGKEKPWMYSCRHAGCRMFKHYQNGTDWKGRQYTDIKNITLTKKISFYFKRLWRN